MAGDLMERSPSRIAFGDQDPAVRLSHCVVTAGNACAGLELLGAIRHDELQTVEFPFSVPYRDHQEVSHLSDPMGLDPLCYQV